MMFIFVKMQMRLLFILFLLSSTPFLQAQNLSQTIRGTVIDKHSQFPLPGASVVVITHNYLGIATDVDGSFKLENIPVGRHSIEISFIGYDPVFLNNVVLNSAKELVLNIELAESVKKLAEVKIVAEKEKAKAQNKTATVSARAFSLEETMRYAGSLNDPARMAANYAGVVGTSDQRNDIVIRGNSPVGLLWRMDGINIPNPNHFGVLGTTGGPVSILNNNLLANSDFMTGAFPAEYGNAVAGAFDLKMRTGNNEKREYWGQVGFNGFELGAEGPFKKDGKASYLASYRYSTLGIFDAIGISFGVPAVPQYQDLSFKIDIPTGLKYGRFSIFGIGGLSHIDLLDSEKNDDEWSFTDGGTDTYFNSDMGVIGLNHLMYISKKTNITTALALSGTRNTIRQVELRPDSIDFDSFGNKSIQTKYTANTQVNHKFNPHHFIRAGFILDLYDVAYSDSFYVDNSNVWYNNYDLKEQMSLVQSYFNYQWRPNEKWTANFGFHHQTFTYNQSHAYEPRLGINYQINEKQSASFGYGIHSQLQPFQVYLSEALIDTTNEIYEATNKNLDFIFSEHFILGYNLSINSNLRIKTEAYYQNVSSLPIQQYSSHFSMANIGADFGIPTVDSLVNEGTGSNYGIELTIEKFFSKNYYFLLTGSVFESKYIASDNVERNTAFNGNYSFNALAGYEFQTGKNGKLSTSLKAARIGGRRYIPIDLDASNLSGKAVYDLNRVYEEKFDDYFRVDAKVSFTLQGKKITQVWAADVQNILNTQNVFQQLYDAESQSIKTEYQLGLFPVGQYKIMF